MTVPQVHSLTAVLVLRILGHRKSDFPASAWTLGFLGQDDYYQPCHSRRLYDERRCMQRDDVVVILYAFTGASLGEKKRVDDMMDPI